MREPFVALPLSLSGWSWSCRFGWVSGPLPAAVAGSVHDDLVCVVSQPVECTLGEDRVIEERDPFFHGSFDVMMVDALRFRSIMTS